jgi:predicted DNA-binding transcriptional regulator AlpA
MTTRAALPLGLTPRFLSREQAAAYVGVGATVFDAEVAAGVWPQAMRRGARDGRLTWDRHLIDAWADRASGLHQLASAPSPPVPADQPPIDALDAAERKALERSRYAPPPQHRHKARHPQTA